MRNFLPRPGLVVAALVLAARPLVAAPLADPQVDAYNLRVGTETFAALYKFTTNTALVETAQAITNLGSDTIKLYLGANASYQSGVTLSSKITNLLTLVRDEPSYHRVLDMPFRHFVMWAYPLQNSDEWWGSGYNSTQGGKDYQEMYNLTHYLLTNYNNSGKTFYLGHWEGDGYLQVNGSWSVTNPAPQTLQGMIGWLNNRQQAVDDAKRTTASSNVWVYNYAECNRVRDAMNNGANNNQRVINYVVPYVTNLDYLSYSSYDSQNLNVADLYATLNYMESMLPTNKAATLPGPRLWIGEYGWGYKTVGAQEPLDRTYIQRLLGWSSNGRCLPFILFWEMYSNYNPNGSTNFCLIDYTNNRVPSWYLQHYFYNGARLRTAQFKEAQGRLPSDTEFSAMTTPLLNQPLPAPISLSVSNGAATLINATTARVSGKLAQGVYGDDQAALWVFWGRQDGGTVPANWEHAQWVAVNTNFNSATFTATLSNLVSQTNYFFRFQATNANATAWAPSASSFGTTTIHASSFGSQMGIFFSGYDRAEALTNFPVLVTLNTNLAGFSYRQFASASGGDLRFTDAGGAVPIPFQIDEWNPSGTSTVWVNVPMLAGPNTVIWAFWGNPLDTNLPAASTNGTAWPDFDLVWHLQEGGFPYADATLESPALTGTAPLLTNGVVGHAEWFNGSSQFLSAGAIDLGPAFTISAWIKLDAAAANIQTICADKPGGWNSPGFALYANTYNTSDGKLILETGDSVNGYNASTGTGVITAGQWHYVVASIDEANGVAQLYVDGTNRTAISAIDADFPDQGLVNWGRFTNSSLYFKGIIDEARIQTGVVSSNWVWANSLATGSDGKLEHFSAVAQLSPALGLSLTGGGALLSWAGAGVGFALYAATNLASPAAWTLASNQPLLTNGQWQIVLPTDVNTPRFYRLESQ